MCEKQSKLGRRQCVVFILTKHLRKRKKQFFMIMIDYLLEEKEIMFHDCDWLFRREIQNFSWLCDWLTYFRLDYTHQSRRMDLTRTINNIFLISFWFFCTFCSCFLFVLFLFISFLFCSILLDNFHFFSFLFLFRRWPPKASYNTLCSNETNEDLCFFK